MMALSGGEVIDATRMGGIARFINHSCDPNCHVEKWVVHDEERVGIFAMRDICAGEELSFDYKFECFDRGGAAQCLCGATNCRGYIGTKTSSAPPPPPPQMARGYSTLLKRQLNVWDPVLVAKTSTNGTKVSVGGKSPVFFFCYADNAVFLIE